ncbi:hypothetical protein Tco_1318858 [Tanacetum coccineum]
MDWLNQCLTHLSGYSSFSLALWMVWIQCLKIVCGIFASPKDIGLDVAKKFKNPSQAPTGVRLFLSGNKKKDAESTKEVSNPNPFDKLNSVKNDVELDDECKPLEKLDYSGDHDGEDEVEPIDNEMASFMASKREIPDDIQSICDNSDIKDLSVNRSFTLILVMPFTRASMFEGWDPLVIGYCIGSDSYVEKGFMNERGVEEKDDNGFSMKENSKAGVKSSSCNLVNQATKTVMEINDEKKSVNMEFPSTNEVCGNFSNTSSTGMGSQTYAK